ncbi:MAG: glycosyltransferase, partial [Lachnospiraceae bacterium]|nr:glycosyltransferase [Lachnospiraceae bacterium]
MRESRGPIDIIVPVYNAYEDLLKCIDSLKKYTDLSIDRLILINDCSPDERIAEYMQSLEKNIVVITNEKNMGFSNNINMGMKYSDDRDVVLLNSDTIVSRGWVDKIVECAYSKEEIGTVTPMSNSATLCSFPNMCQDNPLPEGIELDDLAEVIERCSLKAYPRITVAVGFCMFIKRKTIRDVGFFDAEAFERGYGEENDFCNRAEQMGYIHVMCDDTFIYHKGTVSFMTEQKQKLIEAHDKILQERYPEQMKKNHLYCITNPDQYIRDNIMPYFHVKNGRKNILYLSHLDFIPKAEGSVGGTQFHVRDLTMQLKEKYNVFVMSRDKEHIRLTIYTDKTTDFFMFYVGKPEMFFTFTDSRLREIFASVLDGFEIDIVHVHHTDRMSFDLFYLAHERNIPIAVTLHDYYYICPNVKLYSIEKGYCSGRCDDGECAKCLKDNKNVATKRNYLNKWRYECKKVLDLSDVIVSPSEAAKKIYASIYPELENKITVIEHATEIRKEENPHIDNIQRNLNIEYCYDKIK